jgi:hypothetical protein
MTSKVKELVEGCEKFLVRHEQPDHITDADYSLVANCKSELERLEALNKSLMLAVHYWENKEKQTPDGG